MTKYYRCLAQQGFPPIREYSVALGKVWWWAQNWAQPFGVNSLELSGAGQGACTQPLEPAQNFFLSRNEF